MKKYRSVFLWVICCCLSANAYSAKNLKAMWSYNLFYSPEKGPYIETYLSVLGSSVSFTKNESGKFQGKINVEISFSRENKIVAHDKYNLLSAETSDTLATNFNFLDQQRFLLANGEYDYKLLIYDLGRNLLPGEKPFETSGKLSVYFPHDSICLSDIELLDSYSKSESENPLSRNGYDMVPLVDNYYPKKTNSMKFYVEVYNTSKVLDKELFLLTAKINSADTKKVFEKSSRLQKQEPKPINILLSELNIDELPSGNYEMEVAVINHSNEKLAFQKVFFQRNNAAPVVPDSNGILPFAKQYQNVDTLARILKCLRPVSNQNEVAFADNLIHSDSLRLMQQYFTEFWLSRNQNIPQEEWEKYNSKVNEINVVYKTSIMQGCETDRGRVYLQYGKPDNISESKNEPSAYPYEIWHYYTLKNQSNRKFVFYNPDLVTNDYTLLHSDANGEIFENQWERKLNKRNTSTNNFDTERQPDHFGGKADDTFRNPK